MGSTASYATRGGRMAARGRAGALILAAFLGAACRAQEKPADEAPASATQSAGVSAPAGPPQDIAWIGAAPPSPQELAANPAGYEELLTNNGLALDLATRTVSARAGTLHDRTSLSYPIEYVLVTERGRTHEALFILRCQPSLLDACLRAAGLQPGTPMRFRPRIPPPTDAEMEQGASPWDPVPASGPLVDIEVTWTDDAGAPRKRSLESMLIDVRNGQPLAERDWVYTGSRLGSMRQGKQVVRTFLADLQGDIVALYLTGEGDCLLERNSLDGVDDTLYTLNAEGMPPRGTPVTITFAPTAESVAPAPPPADAAVVAGETGQRLDALLARLAGEGFSGVALVDRGGELLLYKGYGLASRATNAPATTATVYALGDLSRLFTATAILQLQAAGKLARGDTLARHLAGVPEDKAGITLQHLLDRTSGLTAPPAADSPDRETALAAVLAVPLSGAPGAATERRAADAAADEMLLIAVVENASGERWRNYLAEHILGPAGMTQTGLCGEARWDKSQLAHGYESGAADAADLGTPAGTPPTWLGLGRGAVVAPVGDLYRWERALRAGSLLASDLQGDLFAPAPGGVAFRAREGGLVGCSGSLPGLRAHYLRATDGSLTVLVAGNATHADVAGQLAAAVMAEAREGGAKPAAEGKGEGR
jgi:CubicO group peptidase (beta-lactamase class C family)